MTRPGGGSASGPRSLLRPVRSGQGMIRWTGLPLMFTPHVVVSLAEFIWYSIFHQPDSVSPGGVRPPDPYVDGSGIVIVTMRLLNWAAPPTDVWIWVTPVPDRPSST